MAQQDEQKQKPVVPRVVPRVAPRGRAIDRTEEELDEMTGAEAMEALMNEAAADWQENAPDKFKTLLDSKEN